MEFNIYNGQIYYRGVGAALEPVPVASNIPIELDFSQDRGKIAVTFASQVMSPQQRRLFIWLAMNLET